MVEVTEKLSDVMRSTDVKDEQDEQAQIERSHAKHRSDALCLIAPALAGRVLL